jgi:hypothetical protein
MNMREPKPYKCPHCVKSFANNSYLTQHMRIHLGLKPFGPCQFCGKKFTQLSHLQQHIRTHTGEKPYKCKFGGCDKAFSQLSNLQSHSRCHQADKPFKCNSCYKCFTDEAALLDHIPKHKDSKHLKVHVCPYCGKSYAQALYLDKHMTKHADRRGDIRFPKGYYNNDFSMENGFDGLNHLGSLSNQLPADELALRQFQMAAAAAQHSQAAAVQAATTSANFSDPQLSVNGGVNSPRGLSSWQQGASQSQANALAAQFGIGNTTLSQLNLFQRQFQRNFSDTMSRGNDRPGFHMITPLENIRHFSQNTAAAAASFNTCA